MATKHPRRIAITLKDNDFTSSLLATFLNLFVVSPWLSGDEHTPPLKKEDVGPLVEALAFGLQGLAMGPNYHGTEDALKGYVHRRIKVYFDESIPEMDNGEWAVLDRSDPERPYVYIQ